MRKRLLAWGTAAALSLATALPAPAEAAPGLQAGLDAVHAAGVPGAFAEVRDGTTVWRGASGVADLGTGRPVRPGMRQRIGSITKVFTAAAVLRQVERGRVALDAPVGDYLPELVPGDRGRAITVRMLLNHTSGLAEYLPYAFTSLRGLPDLTKISGASIDEHRFTRFRDTDLIKLGVDAPAVPAGVYSNTNYLLLGQLLERVTGLTPEQAITRDVIDPAGLKHTAFPAGPWLDGPHARMYESLFGTIDPARDYSVYDMSWVGVSASLVSTTADLDRFYRQLLAGKVISPASLAEMQRTVPVIAQNGLRIDYGLGLQKLTTDCGTFWGNDGTVWGAASQSWIRADGGRQASVALNLVRWNRPDASGRPQPHPIDAALAAFDHRALCG